MAVGSTKSQLGMHCNASSYFDGVMRFRCPHILAAAVKTAAARQMVSMSSYIRTAVVERLKKEGIEFRLLGTMQNEAEPRAVIFEAGRE